MPIEFSITPSARLVAYSVAGPITAREAKGFLTTVLADPDFRTGFNFFGDRRDESALQDGEYVRAVNDFVELNRSRLAPCRWAVLVASPVAYGMARMWSMMAGGTGVKIQPFYEIEEAVEWLDLPLNYRPAILREPAGANHQI